jgi:tRNA1(Val) A37 N6-methylase TrmN6
MFVSWREEKGRNPTRKELETSITAFELHKSTFEHTRRVIISLLAQEGLTDTDAEMLASHWLHHDDFLLAPIEDSFDFVLGNPPYVRQELIPPTLLREYRLRFKTLYDRADILRCAGKV